MTRACCVEAHQLFDATDRHDSVLGVGVFDGHLSRDIDTGDSPYGDLLWIIRKVGTSSVRTCVVTRRQIRRAYGFPHFACEAVALIGAALKPNDDLAVRSSGANLLSWSGPLSLRVEGLHTLRATRQRRSGRQQTSSDASGAGRTLSIHDRPTTSAVLGFHVSGPNGSNRLEARYAHGGDAERWHRCDVRVGGVRGVLNRCEGPIVQHR